MISRGHHKIFIGMAAGVGKTYRMLQEGRLELSTGRDVVIGYLEPHRREETTAQSEGLPVVPRKKIVYRDKEFEEMDSTAILKRMPELCLVDELAHTNAPGCENQKRYQDVEDLLTEGIDIFSTVNVQHLESLNDEVAELTGVRVKETLPDSVLKQADEVVLIDLTPEALIQRLKDGKIYPLENVPSALGSFFKIENLAALREIALRQVAEDVEAKRLVHETVSRDDDRVLSSAPQAVAERLLALVRPLPGDQRVVRRAWRSSQRLGAQLDILWVRHPDRAIDRQTQDRVAALSRLASILGVDFLQEASDDFVATVKRVAAERGSTYLLMGPSNWHGLLGRFKRPLSVRLSEALPGVDVRTVADRALLRRQQ